MLIAYLAGRITHVQTELGLDLIRRGLATEVKPPTKKPSHITWEVRPGESIEHPPFLKASCSCGRSVYSGGPTAATTIRLIHAPTCEGGSGTPPHVVKQYQRAYDDWRSGNEPRPSSVSPAQRKIEQARFEQLQKSRHLSGGTS